MIVKVKVSSVCACICASYVGRCAYMYQYINVYLRVCLRDRDFPLLLFFRDFYNDIFNMATGF